jgi:hypothetical protein
MRRPLLDKLKQIANDGAARAVITATYTAAATAADASAAAPSSKKSSSKSATAATSTATTAVVVNLKLGGRGLPKNDLLSDSDPLAVLYVKNKEGKFSFVSQTEHIENEHNPDFEKVLEFKYTLPGERSESDADSDPTVFKLLYYDVDENEALDADDLLGSVEFTLADLLKKQTSQKLSGAEAVELPLLDKLKQIANDGAARAVITATYTAEVQAAPSSSSKSSSKSSRDSKKKSRSGKDKVESAVTAISAATAFSSPKSSGDGDGAAVKKSGGRSSKKSSRTAPSNSGGASDETAAVAGKKSSGRASKKSSRAAPAT